MADGRIGAKQDKHRGMSQYQGLAQLRHPRDPVFCEGVSTHLRVPAWSEPFSDFHCYHR